MGKEKSIEIFNKLFVYLIYLYINVILFILKLIHIIKYEMAIV